MLVLFGNFYIHAYIKRKRTGIIKKSEDNSNGYVNHAVTTNGYTKDHSNGRTDGQDHPNGRIDGHDHPNGRASEHLKSRTRTH